MMKQRLTISPGASIFWLLSLLILVSCGEDDTPNEDDIIVRTTNQTFNLGSHNLQGVTSTERGHTVIYESGLGADYTVWTISGILREVGKYNSGVAYSRGGYGNSELGPEPRDLVQLSDELLALKRLVSPNNKVILVGHSWGGAIIRTFAIRFPEEVAGLVFVDPSHERQLILSQEQEDNVVQNYSSLPGASKEAEMLREGVTYLTTLPNLPDIPITVLTSLRDADSSWAVIHRSLGDGVSNTNFKQVTTTASGHNIHTEEPSLVISEINNLIDQLN